MLIPVDSVSSQQILAAPAIGQGRFQPEPLAGSSEAQLRRIFEPLDTVEISDDAQFAAGSLGVGNALAKGQPGAIKDSAQFPVILARLLQAYGLDSPVQEPGLAVQVASDTEASVALKQEAQAPRLALVKGAGAEPSDSTGINRNLNLSLLQGVYPFPRQNEVPGQFNLGQAVDFVA